MFPTISSRALAVVIWLALLGGLFCGAGGLWLAYHLVRAVLFYVGAL